MVFVLGTNVLLTAQIEINGVPFFNTSFLLTILKRALLNLVKSIVYSVQ